MMISQRTVLSTAFLAALLIFQTHAQTNTNSTLTGQWDFNLGDLRATVGTNLQFVGQTGASTTFEQAVINDRTANVMRITEQSEGILMFHGAEPNGGGTNVNIYTLVMDLMWPAESDGTFRSLFVTDTNNVSDPAMLVNPDNAIGVNNAYSGRMDPGTWYRLALSFDLTNAIPGMTNAVVYKYLNGQPIGTQILGAGVDGAFSAGRALLLFTSNFNEIAPGYIDRIQFYSDALNQEAIAELGEPVGDGGPPVSGDVKIDSIRLVGNDVEISLSGGGTLQLQRQSSLGVGNWEPVGQVTGSGTLTVPAGGRSGFFRAQRL